MIFIIQQDIFKKIIKFKMSSNQTIVLGFAAIILIGAILLNLPIASKSGEQVGFVNALFTSTSAVCVTGLVVVDTGTYWTIFGQVVIIALIQIGGLGFMTIATLFALIVGKRITLRERLLIQESLNQNDLQGMVRLTKGIIITTFIIESIGAVLYSIVFIPQFGYLKGIWMGIFHAISGFCNAGFDLIGNFNSFTPYANNFIININTMALIIIGGLGFSVWIDIYDVIRKRDCRRFSLHSKVVLITTAILIGLGAVLIFIFEHNNPDTLMKLGPSGKMLASMFHSVSPRTAGFNTLDMGALTDSTKFLTVILMFIGGSPGSTAGGIKTATAAILFMTVVGVVFGKEDTEIFERRVPKDLVYKAMSITIISLVLVVFVTMVLSITEEASFLTLLFETTSAFGTVGLSLNFSPSLTIIGRIIISLTMFAGRVGPLTLALAFARSAARNRSNLKYPEDRILVG